MPIVSLTSMGILSLNWLGMGSVGMLASLALAVAPLASLAGAC
jgi:hypothetical protein